MLGVVQHPDVMIERGDGIDERRHRAVPLARDRLHPAACRRPARSARSGPSPSMAVETLTSRSGVSGSRYSNWKISHSRLGLTSPPSASVCA